MPLKNLAHMEDVQNRKVLFAYCHKSWRGNGKQTKGQKVPHLNILACMYNTMCVVLYILLLSGYMRLQRFRTKHIQVLNVIVNLGSDFKIVAHR